MTGDDPRHGTENGYKNLGCRCDRCREAHRIYFAQYKQRHPEQYRKAALRMRVQRQARRAAA